MLDSEIAIANLTSASPRLSTLPSQHKRYYLWALLVTDAVMLMLAFGVAYWLRFTVEITVSPGIIPPTDRYIRLVLILIPFWLFLFATMHLYDFRHLLGGTTEYARAFNACTSGMMLVVILSFMDEDFVIARGWLVMSWMLACVLVCGGRLLLRRVAYNLRKLGYFVESAIIVGTNSEAMALAAQLRNSSFSGVAVLGFVDTEGSVPHGSTSTRKSKGPILGTLHTLNEVIKQRKIREVIIASTALSREQLLDVFQHLVEMPGVEMRLSSGLYEVFTTNMKVSMTGAVPLMSLNRLRLDPLEASLKRMLDCLVILLASITLLPIFVIIALLIKIDSPGPVFYRRRVMGIGGKQFDAFKFRTMVVNGEEVLEQHPELQAELREHHKLREDPRVTRMGRFLRATSLDELPQLINVLLGQMSLVGPRMISPDEADKYGVMLSNLLTVKPGITGIWQVSGRSDLSYEERVRLDMYYIRNYSIWTDLQILFIHTLPAVLKRRGAY